MLYPPAFIDVCGVSYEAPTPTGVWRRWLGRPEAKTSILRQVTFRLEPGVQAVVLGAEGSGKSTLLRLLVGAVKPTTGKIIINGCSPADIKDLAAGFISPEETEPTTDSVDDILTTFARTHAIANATAKLTTISEAVRIKHLLSRSVPTLSLTQRLRVNVARAALSDAPVILADDLADHLDLAEINQWRQTLFKGRVWLLATRQAAQAEALNLPLLVVRKGSVAALQTQAQLASTTASPVSVQIWFEGIQYDLIRELKQLNGVTSATVAPAGDFLGQKVRLHVISVRYLPLVYDVISRAPVIRVEEKIANLSEIVSRLY